MGSVASEGAGAQARLSEQTAIDYVRFLERRLLNRTDKIGVATAGGKPAPALVPDAATLTALLRCHVDPEAPPVTLDLGVLGHVTSRFRAGTYTPDLDGKTRFVCLDFDGPGHSWALRDPLHEALRARRRAQTLGLAQATLIERSGSGGGFHLWIVLADLFPARAARVLGHWVAPNDAYLAKSGPCGEQWANPVKGQGIEVFPKQDKIVGDRAVGYQVWLPLWHGASAAGACHFVDDEGKPATEAALAGLQPAAGDAFRAAVRTCEGKAVERQAETRVRHDPEFREFIQQVVARVDLYAWYAEVLTGKVSNAGWLEARDAKSSGSGDEHPSARVNDTDSNYERGWWKSFNGDESTDMFHWAVARGRSPSFWRCLEDTARSQGIPIPVLKPRVRVVATTPGQSAANPPPIRHQSATPTASHEAPVDTCPPVTPIEAEFPTTGSPGIPGHCVLPEAPEAPVAPPVVPPPPASSPARRQVTVNNRQMHEVLDEITACMLEAGPNVTGVLMRDDALVRVAEDGRALVMSTEQLMVVASRCVQFVRATMRTGRGGQLDVTYTECDPPKDIIRALDVSRFHALDEVVDHPVLRSDGQSWIHKPGYDVAERIWLVDHGHCRVATPGPTEADVAAARAVLDDIVGEFPFLTESDRAHAFAAVISPLVRRAIVGHVPMHLVQAPTAGTGKSLLAEALQAIVCGRGIESSTLTVSEDESRKEITTELLKRRPISVFDNFPDRSRVVSALLCSILTASRHSCRVLGSLRSAQVDVRTVFMATGNNPLLSDELNRRTVRIKLDAKVEKPETRTGFIHRLPAYALAQRGAALAACQTIVNAWISRGCPQWTVRTLGSYEDYARVVGALCEVAGYKDFLVRDDADVAQQRGEVAEFLKALRRDPVLRGASSATGLVDWLSHNDLLPEELTWRNANDKIRALGRYLQNILNQSFGGLVLRKQHTNQGSRYFVEDAALESSNGHA